MHDCIVDGPQKYVRCFHSDMNLDLSMYMNLKCYFRFPVPVELLHLNRMFMCGSYNWLRCTNVIPHWNKKLRQEQTDMYSAQSLVVIWQNAMR